MTSHHEGAPPSSAAAVRDAVHVLGDDLLILAATVHDLAEEAFAETGSAAAIATAVRARGHDVEIGVGGLPTALRARAGRAPEDGGTGRIAILAEYDALPGIGHACGHQVIAAAAVGAFLALADQAADLPGEVVLLGTPAEEGSSGKELLARGGALADLDAAIMVHPFSHDVVDHPFLGRRQLVATYHGIAAHASAQPFMGRNALDAIALNYQAVAYLRQHLPPSDRVHGVVREGGQRPSIVPERAQVEYYVRSAAPETLRDLSRRLEDVARGVALATGTEVELTWDPLPATLPVRTNDPLVRRWSQHQSALGRLPLAGGVVSETLAGSTDFGNVSARIPGIHPMIAVGDAALHTREFERVAASPSGDLAVLDGAAGLALTALDWLHDGELRAAVRADFEAAGGVLDVEGYFA
ncbi:M20 family metallopeptidase [Serinibacter arcticus]|uniref:M20 family metallopeptidase n=1 Tax=Serinibacter arcticus TaxID=1655435 RepID=UPI001F43E961|nr:M20 family metallopeptidase [Serinibacter arcticus]